MKQKIADLLGKLAVEHGITVLFAVENGSRAWGMESHDSDYDVRFVFYRPLKDYITLNKPAEVITAAYDENMQPHEVQGSLADISGFDIFKYLKLLASSNPTALEWLNSPIVYTGDNNIPLRDYMKDNFSRKKLFCHYFSLFKNSWKVNIDDKKEITYKKYLYAMRGLLNAEYVLKFDKIPPLLLRETAAEMRNFIPSEVSDKLNEVIEIKSKGLEKEKILRIPVFDEYFASALNQTCDSTDDRRVDYKVFDDYLRGCLSLREKA